jgi:hypothetical protein
MHLPKQLEIQDIIQNTIQEIADGLRYPMSGSITTPPKPWRHLHFCMLD